jgi:hypothetical protein
MRFGIWALVALIVGAFGAHFLLQDRGYVLISFLGWNVEMSVPGLALMLILFYVAVRVLIRILMAPGQIGDVIEAHRTRRAGSRLARGLIHMTEGDFRRGERLLTDRLKDHDAKVVNYLIAARAADAQGSIERRDEWLRLAGTSDPKAEIAVLLTQAELEIKRGEPGAALVTLAKRRSRISAARWRFGPKPCSSCVTAQVWPKSCRSSRVRSSTPTAMRAFWPARSRPCGRSSASTARRSRPSGRRCRLHSVGGRA